MKREKTMQKYLEAGRIINKRGLKGELKVQTLCDSAEILCSFGALYLDKNGTDKRQVLSAKTYNGFSYLLLSGITNSEEADKVKGKLLYLDRADYKLPEEKIFVVDLLGLSVYDVDSGNCYGILDEVMNLGASDIYRITDQNTGKEHLIPAVPEIVVKIDPEQGIYLRPLPGMFDEAEELR